ncbi:MAG: DUF1294 domain-containing protein [Clostridia bacterium]|nr:DUF1294 domain-containing protein [Clostridia bacterium]
MVYKIVLIYLALISLTSIITTAWDKHCAKRDMWRVPEKTLLILSALGGSVAMYITMKTIRHKTKHPKFMVGIPVIIFLQVAAVAAVWYFLYK